MTHQVRIKIQTVDGWKWFYSVPMDHGQATLEALDYKNEGVMCEVVPTETPLFPREQKPRPGHPMRRAEDALS